MDRHDKITKQFNDICMKAAFEIKYAIAIFIFLKKTADSIKIVKIISFLQRHLDQFPLQSIGSFKFLILII